MSQQRILPVFPLEIVVFPGEKLNLHIFEDRYKELISDCEASGSTFVILPFLHKRLAGSGTEIRLEKIARKYPDGRSDISVRGFARLKLDQYMPELDDKLYGGGLLSAREEIDEPDFALSVEILELFRSLFESLGIHEQVLLEAHSFRSYDIAHKVGMNPDQEYELLEIDSEYERQVYLHTHLTRILPVVQEMEKLKKIISLNGHFREINPPKID